MSEELMMTDQAKIRYLEGKIQHLTDRLWVLETYKDDRFWQAFCASLTGLRANNQIRVFDPETKETVSSNESIEIYVGLAIEYAHEAVRQVGELNNANKSDECPTCKADLDYRIREQLNYTKNEPSGNSGELGKSRCPCQENKCDCVQLQSRGASA